MCEAVDTTARPRRIRRFNSGEVFVGGSVVEQFQGDYWVERLQSVPVDEFTVASRVGGA